MAKLQLSHPNKGKIRWKRKLSSFYKYKTRKTFSRTCQEIDRSTNRVPNQAKDEGSKWLIDQV
ncbi:hypothetical protein Pst134EA_024508 [Puccinia striiformis f. sp. tritici]|uniref:hypothetical protein n=1 Tax=Puccinia striiformis f. sp. tritici TaxID=168172 RepID=UPI0020079FC3|nr:hypothetical protein Pst134EA_024508 [Puccinia striiformis f. sp. tritici]KAH9444921.1 hypothetical protein Pst134EB_025174 [Puccinia striiformis f. sp. tritici]KAH9453640.1 hypothetical protein Pst134EA_024508 [Puccinia striiformis f. sp. tritici]